MSWIGHQRSDHEWEDDYFHERQEQLRRRYNIMWVLGFTTGIFSGIAIGMIL